MSWVDLVVVALALLAAISGWRHGMAVALLSFVGVLGGAIIGVRVAPLLAEGISNTNTRVIVSVAVVVMLVVLGETSGVFLGRRVRDRITGERFLVVDSTLGSVLQALAVVVAAWLVALPLATASLPGIAAGVRGSQVLSAVDSVMPTAAKQLPAELRQLLDNSGFPDVLSPFARTPVTATGPPDSALARSPACRGRAGERPQDPRQGAVVPDGSWRAPGFVFGPELVMTNAHVVAGTDEHRGRGGRRRGRTSEMPARGRLLRPEGRRRRALRARPAAPSRCSSPPTRPRSGDDAIVLGYPLDGPFTADAGRDPPADPAARPGHLRQRRGHAARSTPCAPRCARATPAAR